MSTLPDCAIYNGSSLAEIFLLNQSRQIIQITWNGIDASFVLRPKYWISRQVRRGITLTISTWDLGRYGFELYINVIASAPIARCQFEIPHDVGTSLLWAWDGLSWIQLDGGAIHDLVVGP